MAEESFSFRELQRAQSTVTPTPRSLQASDGTQLAYRRFAPASPTATLVFYHGGGAHSGAGYQHVGSGLQSQYNIAVYTPDIRGHGASGGPRGDAPNPEQVWADVTTLIHRARTDHPGVPVFLGGHSSGAALALSYAGQADHEPVSGYVLVSPQLGSQAHVDRSSAATPFVRVDGAAFAGYAASRGTLHGHDYAVQFNYPAELLARDPGLVPAITVNMSVALIPAAPESAFAGLDRPFGLWIGSEDELFIPEKVLAFGELATSVRPASEIGTIRGANHLGVLLKAHEAAGPWMVKTVQNP